MELIAINGGDCVAHAIPSRSNRNQKKKKNTNKKIKIPHTLNIHSQSKKKIHIIRYYILHVLTRSDKYKSLKKKQINKNKQN